MDWIDEQFEVIIKKLKLTSLKNVLQVYIFFGAFAIIIFSFMTMIICNNWMKLIIFKYAGLSASFSGEFLFLYEIYDEMQTCDKILVTIIPIMNNFLPIIYSIISVVIISKLYYKNKLEEPINILNEGAKYISREDYSFECVYRVEDEMGDICKTFDNMRCQLIKNKENIWKQINEERTLKSAFAHDLRTPLTVLKGYVDLLIMYYPEGKINDEKMIETLDMMKNQIVRLENFSATMKKIDTFTELEANKIKTKRNDFIRTIELLIKGINDTHNKKLELYINDIKEELDVDLNIIMQVLENILSNALRYCKYKIDVTINMENYYLQIYVKDDGRGFSKEELKKAHLMYYTSLKDAGHYGLGLSICKLLCEKHNGNISLFNSIDGGAIICTTFLCK